MNNKKISSQDYRFFFIKALTFLALISFGFILALTSFFYAWVAWILAIAFGLVLFKKQKISLKLSKELWVAMLSFLALVIIFSLFITPTVFSGRDQGAISEAAIRLAQNHQFAFSTPSSNAFFALHGPGRALNFPGFYYTKTGQLITQFPLVYIVWLALFFSLFGLIGLTIANAAAIWIFLMSFYLLLRQFLKTPAAFLSMIFVATSFCFMWFLKFTLSENMALPLLWLTILSLMLFLKDLRKLYFIVLLASSFLLCFTRIEGFAFLLIAMIVLYLNPGAKLFLQKNSRYFLWSALIVFLILFGLNARLDINFYRELAKAIMPSLNSSHQDLAGSINETTLPSFYNVRILFIYGLLDFFIFGIISIAVFAHKKQFYKLIPFFITLPTFVYLVDSHISSDHPWMLRRYLFSLLPVTIFYSSLLLGQWYEKKPSKRSWMIKLSALTIYLILILGNLPAFTNFLTYSENKSLLSQTQAFSQKFSNKDLILLDQQVTRDGWSMLSGPMSFLFGKNAVYFFNVQDLASLNTDAFSNVYLVVPTEKIPYYQSILGSHLLPTENYAFQVSNLSILQSSATESANFPQKKNFITTGEIFKFTK